MLLFVFIKKAVVLFIKIKVMSIFNYRIAPFAAMFLLAGGNVIAQTNNIPVLQNNSKQVQVYNAATYHVPDDEYLLPWKPIPERDISSQTRVLRDIDVNDVDNKAFSNEAASQNKTLVSILIEGVLSGKIKAYDGSVSGFRKEYTKDELIAMLTPGKGSAGFNPGQVSKYQIKEDWLFFKDKGTVVVRILGLAPVRAITGPDGKVTEEPLFWIFYPNCRNYLAEHKVSDGNNSEETNWDRVLVGRKFKSKIIKANDPICPVPYKKQ